MAFTGFPAAAFEFYEGLTADNSKTYWTAHKDVYDEAVRAPMEALAAALEPEFGSSKTFRPYRDVRFSADKSPYKTHQGLFCQTANGVGFYFQLDAEGVMTAGGFYSHAKEQTARYRSAVDSPAIGAELEKLLTSLRRKGFEVGGDTVRTRPRGVPADHPRLELMRHESLTVHRSYPADEKIETSKAFELVRGDWRAIRPFNDWVTANVGGA